MRIGLLVPLLAGCGDTVTAATTGTTDSTDDTVTDQTTVPLQGGCAVQPENVLRYDCVFQLTEAGPLVLDIDGGSRSRAYTSDDIAVRHEITAFLLKPQTPYTWTATTENHALTGSFTTVALPQAVDLQADVSGNGTTDTIVVPFQCGEPGHLVAIDERGEVEWYQDLTSGLGDGLEGLVVTGFDATSESVIGLLHHSHISEFDWTGTAVGSAQLDTDYLLPTHHSVHRRDGRRYVLNADVFTLYDGTYLLDGVYVFDTDWTLLGEWSLRDVLTPSGGGPPGGYWGAEFPGAIDYSHTNSIYVDEQRDWILSMRGLNTVIKIRGDLDAPDFGTLIWSLSSTGNSPLGTDYLVSSIHGVTTQLDFSDQHHAHVEEDGGLWLFDNRGFGDDSRGIRMTLEDTYAVADIDRAIVLPERCAVQSSVYLLPNDHTLLTCATSQTLYEFEPASPDPIWVATLNCGADERATTTVRGQPIYW